MGVDIHLMCSFKLLSYLTKIYISQPSNMYLYQFINTVDSVCIISTK